ncbi:MAG: hypothetical protein HQL53_01615 [Magnetococcales bacterium]|nr:hypothetical protein [Magnetococcales bacterium]
MVSSDQLIRGVVSQMAWPTAAKRVSGSDGVSGADKGAGDRVGISAEALAKSRREVEAPSESGWIREARTLLYAEEVDLALDRRFMEILFDGRHRGQPSHRELLEQWRYEEPPPKGASLEREAVMGFAVQA